MKNIYSLLALSYRAWYYRTTPAEWDIYGPSVGFTVMQSFNILSLLLSVAWIFPDWLLILVQCTGSIAAWAYTRHIYRRYPAATKFADSLSVEVPGIREFSLLYSYMLFTVLALIAGVV